MGTRSSCKPHPHSRSLGQDQGWCGGRGQRPAWVWESSICTAGLRGSKKHTTHQIHTHMQTHTYQEVMDVTEMDQKPTSNGVRNKQKQNKALAFRWKAVYWETRARNQGWEGGCLLGGHCLGRSLEEAGCKGNTCSPPTGRCLRHCLGGPCPTGRRRCPHDRESKEGGTYLVAQKWLVHIWGSVQYLSLNKILVVLLNHELSAL